MIDPARVLRPVVVSEALRDLGVRWAPEASERGHGLWSRDSWVLVFRESKVICEPSTDPVALADRIDRKARKSSLRQVRRQERGAVPVPGLPLVARRPGVDERLPTMRMLREQRTVDWMEPRPTEMTLVAHRLGKRAVLRAGSPRGSQFVKLYKPRSNFADAVLARSRIVARPHLTHLDRERQIVAFEDVGDSPVWTIDRLGTIVSMLRSLHSTDSPPRVPVHDTSDEARVMARAARLAILCRPQQEPIVSDALERATKRLYEHAAAPTSLVHRDAHAEQFRPDSGAILDLDTMSIADPYVDLGNLAATWERRFGRNVIAEVADAYGIPVDRRLRAWLDASRLRLACEEMATTDPSPWAARIVEALAE